MASATTQHVVSHDTSEIKPDPKPLSLDLTPTITIIRPCLCPKCKPDLYQLAQHPLDIQHLNPRRLPILQVWQHHPYYLATLAVNSFKDVNNPKHIPTFSQHLAQHMWKDFWLVSDEYHLLASTDNLLTLPIQKILIKPVEIFNNLFFLGQIPANIIHLQWGCSASQGQSRHEADNSVIEINPHHRRHFRNPTGVLRTLLHEMIHVFLSRYSCHRTSDPRTDKWCTNQACKTLYSYSAGESGHGMAWHYLAKAIEEEGERFLAGFSIWLGRQEVVMEEIEAGGWWPSECDFETGGLLERGYDEVGIRAAMLGFEEGKDDDVAVDGDSGELEGTAHSEEGPVLRESLSDCEE